MKNRYDGYSGKKYDDEPKKGSWSSSKASEDDKYKDKEKLKNIVIID